MQPKIASNFKQKSQFESAELLVVGLNPAFQSTLHFDHFKPGHVNRAFRKCNSIGGKGRKSMFNPENFSIACWQYGEADKVTVLQATGGMTGDYINAYLNELHIHHVTIPLGKTTRTCTTVLDKFTGDMTELIEPAGRVELSEKALIESTAKTLITQSPRLEAIALCGTLPSGITGSIYSMIAELKPEHCLLLLDAFQNTVECLITGKVDILKINAEESMKLADMPTDKQDIMDSGIKLLKMYDLPILAITDGPNGAILFERKNRSNINVTVSRFKIPPLEEALKGSENLLELDSPGTSHSHSLPEATGELFQVRVRSNLNISGMNLSPLANESKGLLLNPLGAGDTCSAIFLMEYLDTRDCIQAFRHGLAAASASCLEIDTTSHFDKRIKEKIFDQITYETSHITLPS